MRRIFHSVLVPVLFFSHASADEPAPDAFPLRNYNPFLQIFGLPAFQSQRLLQPGQSEFDASLVISNDEDDALRSEENLVIDGETYILSVSYKRRLLERFEFGIEVPFVRHSGGVLDSAIESWHDLFGLSNSSRDNPDDRLQFLYDRGEATLYDLRATSSGIGDVQLSVAMPLRKTTLRAAIKLPTGNPDKLTGSGAVDVSLGLYASRSMTLFERTLAYSGFVGILALGDGDVLPQLQRSAVPYGGFALRWHMTDRFAIAAQWYGQGSYFDSDIDEIGGSTMQLAVGADYQFKRVILRAAIVEDVTSSTTPDFALHLSIRSASR
jgi:hypothetical protein